MRQYNEVFKIDFEKLIKLLLPTFMRKSTIVAFIKAVIKPLINEKEQFDKNREDNLYRLSITPQVFSLEKMLNDRYDPALRRIFITDGEFIEQDYIYLEVEEKSIYIYEESEYEDIYIYDESEIGYEGDDFYVNIPSYITVPEDEVNELLYIYKLVSKKHKIIRF